jgi:NAD(P)-dependent dehydrogenase (short-subunit alcohol dehydrogenase family)
MSKVWLVTGSASGLGRNIAEAVLASGDRGRIGALVRTRTYRNCFRTMNRP